MQCLASTNEVRGTSYSSRIEDPKYQFAGKTGTSQVKRITKSERELKFENKRYSIRMKEIMLYMLHLDHIKIQDMHLV